MRVTYFSAASRPALFALMPSLACTISVLLAGLGVYVAAVFFPSRPSSLARYRSISPWALVTGGSSGIGAAWADFLAANGFNLILVARSRDSLAALASQLSKTHLIVVETISADLVAFEHAARDCIPLKMALDRHPPSVVIHNLGVKPVVPQRFLDFQDSHIDDVLRGNVNCTLDVTRLTLPAMVEAHCGLVVFTGSLAATIPSPLQTAYSASKAAVETFARGLSAEYGMAGVDVVCFSPGWIRSAMTRSRTSRFLVTPAEFVMRASRFLTPSVARHRCVVSPVPSHRLWRAAAHFLPGQELARLSLSNMAAYRSLLLDEPY
jgi:short-subunit dehydrogenase